MIGCDSLNIQHPELRDPAARTSAANSLFEIALACSTRFRLIFDRPGLLRALGGSAFAALLPSPPRMGGPNEPLDDQTEELDRERAALLRRVLSFREEGWTEGPFTHIDQVVLYDARGDMVLRATDGADFILFVLPADQRARLLARYAIAGIPGEVVETVNVDITQGA